MTDWTTIRILKRTRDELKQLRGVGVTYDQVIAALLESRETVPDSRAQTVVHP